MQDTIHRVAVVQITLHYESQIIYIYFNSSNTDLTRTKEGINEGGEEIIRFTKPGQDKVNQNNSAFGQLPAPYGEDSMDLNSQVIKVYRGDHTSRFFVLTKVRLLLLLLYLLKHFLN